MTRRLAREEGLLVGGRAGWRGGGAGGGAARRAGDVVVVLLPDGGRGYLQDLQRRLDGRLRLPAHRDGRTVGDVLRAKAHDIPALVHAHPTETVRDAIDILREYAVSQMPVVKAEPPVMAGEVAGSVSERDCSTRFFTGRANLADPVGAHAAPLPIVGAGEERGRDGRSGVEKSDAALVLEDGKPVGVPPRPSSPSSPPTRTAGPSPSSPTDLTAGRMALPDGPIRLRSGPSSGTVVPLPDRRATTIFRGPSRASAAPCPRLPSACPCATRGAPGLGRIRGEDQLRVLRLSRLGQRVQHEPQRRVSGSRIPSSTNRPNTSTPLRHGYTYKFPTFTAGATVTVHDTGKARVLDAPVLQPDLQCEQRRGHRVYLKNAWDDRAQLQLDVRGQHEVLLTPRRTN